VVHDLRDRIEKKGCKRRSERGRRKRAMCCHFVSAKFGIVLKSRYGQYAGGGKVNRVGIGREEKQDGGVGETTPHSSKGEINQNQPNLPGKQNLQNFGEKKA